MDRLSFMRLMKRYDFEKISSQTVPGTYSEISHDSLLAEQVNNRSSAQWKKAEIIFCSGRWKGTLVPCIYGWKTLAEQTCDQYLVIQDESGLYRVYNWHGQESSKSLDEILDNF